MPETAADETLEVPTASGPAGVRLTLGGGTGLLCLGHGAGGGTDAPDLLAVTGAAMAAGWTVARIDQPYRVAGRRAPAPAPRLDEAWLTAVAGLRRRFPDGPQVSGGRSSGARVACRTAMASGAAGVICLAFPLRPPQRPEKSRLEELLGAGVPTLVVQGERDPFGGPADFPPFDPAQPVELVAVPGDHSLRRSADAVAAAVAAWLAQRVA